MKHLYRICVLYFFAHVYVDLFSQNESLLFKPLPFEESKKQSAVTSQLIFVTATADWCEPCKLMEQSVFVDHRVGSFFNKHFFNIKIPIDKSEGSLFALQYAIDTLPSFLFLSSDGTLISKSTGYKKATELVSMAQRAMHPDLLDQAMATRYENGDRKPDFILNYLKRRSADQQSTIINEYINNKIKWSDAHTLHLLFRLHDSLLVEHLPRLLSNYKEYEKLVGSDYYLLKINAIVEQKLYCSPQNLNLEEVKTLLTNPDYKNGKQLIANYKYYYYKQVHKDLNQYGLALIEAWSMNPQKVSENVFTDELNTLLELNPRIISYKPVEKIVKKNATLKSSKIVAVTMANLSRNKGLRSKIKYWNKRAA